MIDYIAHSGVFMEGYLWSVCACGMTRKFILTFYFLSFQNFMFLLMVGKIFSTKWLLDFGLDLKFSE